MRTKLKLLAIILSVSIMSVFIARYFASRELEKVSELRPGMTKDEVAAVLDGWNFSESGSGLSVQHYLLSDLSSIGIWFESGSNKLLWVKHGSAVIVAEEESETGRSSLTD
jgi:hypothetical protein